VPSLNANPSNFIPQSISIPAAPPIYNIPVCLNKNPHFEKTSVHQRLIFYDHLIQHQNLVMSLLMSNPALAHLVPQHITAASLSNPFGVSLLNPALMYTAAPIADRVTNLGQLEPDISKVCHMSSQNLS
jgi:hypothetical protein